jgi:hypothetical protein
VAELLEPSNKYLLTYDMDGQPITIGPNNQTTLRIYWGIGIIYKNVTGITITESSSSTHPVYTVTPVEDATIYQTNATPGGTKTMTVNAGVNGMKYFGVLITPVRAHDGLEAVVFVHLRNGMQDSMNVTKADFDVVQTSQAGFNVQSGDVVKAYVVDDLTNNSNFNPIILQ